MIRRLAPPRLARGLTLFQIRAALTAAAFATRARLVLLARPADLSPTPALLRPWWHRPETWRPVAGGLLFFALGVLAALAQQPWHGPQDATRDGPHARLLRADAAAPASPALSERQAQARELSGFAAAWPPAGGAGAVRLSGF